jgi:D-glycero-D-manno-heptose 1,7-bisphosphate phosphatase
LFHTFAEEKNLDLSQVYAVGDSFRDIEASLAAKAKPLLVKTGKGSLTLQSHPQLTLPIFDNLYAAANYIIAS